MDLELELTGEASGKWEVGKATWLKSLRQRVHPQSERRESGVVSGIRSEARRGVIVDHFKRLKFGSHGKRREGPSIN